MIFTIASIVLLTFYVLLIISYWIGWMMIKPYRASPQQPAPVTFTILVPARNEEENIGHCLQGLLSQSYDVSKVEVIVINDHSTDRTAGVVREVIANNKTGITVSLLDMKDDPEQRRLKKAAITFGIEHAHHDYIILTDADCHREHRWLSAISDFIQQHHAKMIYAPVVFRAKNLFEKIQSMEFAGLVGIGGAAIRLKNPNMCSAANLIFEKKVFREVGGYAGNDGIASGDDEFLMHKVFKHYPDAVHFMKSSEAIVYTSANTSVQELANQRKRWVSKSTKYEDRYITAVLVGAYLFNAAVLINLFVNPMLGLLMLTLKTITECLFLFSVLRFFNRASYLLFLPVAEVFHIVYVLIIGIWANIGTYNWKGRNVK